MIVWVASYPRSGNTFLRIVLHKAFGIETYSVYGDLKSIQDHARTREIVGHRLFDGEFDEARCRSDEGLWHVKTHAPWNDRYAHDRAIYVVRDPRDAMNSFLQFQRDYWGQEPSFSDLISGNCFCGSWQAHVNGWTRRPPRKVLVLRFEDLVSDTKTAIGQIAGFTGIQPAAVSVPTFEELHGINGRFFRSGRSNTAAASMSEEDRDRLWQTGGDVMGKFGYAR